jgi:anti-sigma regulatory factor (Ser/Thr protein kinase)
LGLKNGIIRRNFVIPADDFTAAGEASSSVKKMLIQLGVDPQKVKKTAISMYEAEINAVIHANGGSASVEIDRNRVFIKIQDKGPGIPDLELAMKEGYTTAPDVIREMGFGAGMGLPNMKRYADLLEIKTEVGKGTTVEITVYLS